MLPCSIEHPFSNFALVRGHRQGNIVESSEIGPWWRSDRDNGLSSQCVLSSRSLGVFGFYREFGRSDDDIFEL